MPQPHAGILSLGPRRNVPESLAVDRQPESADNQEENDRKIKRAIEEMKKTFGGEESLPKLEPLDDYGAPLPEVESSF